MVDLRAHCHSGLQLTFSLLPFAIQPVQVLVLVKWLRQGFSKGTCSSVMSCDSDCVLQVTVGRSHWNCCSKAAIWMLGFARNIVFLPAFVWQAWHLWHSAGSGQPALHTTLSHITFSRATLSHTSLSRTAPSHKLEIQLQHATLSPTNYHTALSHTALSLAILSHTTLSHTILSRTTLWHTTLSHTILSHTTLSHSQPFRHNFVTHTTLSHTTPKQMSRQEFPTAAFCATVLQECRRTQCLHSKNVWGTSQKRVSKERLRKECTAYPQRRILFEASTDWKLGSSRYFLSACAHPGPWIPSCVPKKNSQQVAAIGTKTLKQQDWNRFRRTMRAVIATRTICNSSKGSKKGERS